jgi:putative membrane protein
MHRRTFLSVFALGTTSAVALATGRAEAFFTGSSRYRLAALEAGEFAMATSRLALERSRSPAVRRFAEAELVEQTNIAAQLRGRSGEVALRADHAATINQLAAASPRSFDRAYLRGQAMGHRELYAINTTYVAEASAYEQSVAAAGLPLIRLHISTLARLSG